MKLGWLSPFFHLEKKGGEYAINLFLEFLKEIIKGVVRESIAHLFKKNILETKKTTLSSRRRRQRKSGFRKYKR
ncbi:hypothetical protein COL60_16705 [Bacillus pseudomycoides]|nr:hypothetical protein COL60_16705 [Bacillus pseudomycoides]